MRTLIALLILTLLQSNSIAQIVNIPDPVFKDNLVNFPVVDTNGDGSGDSDADVNNDGEIQINEAEAVFGLYLSVSPIYTLEGLEEFINLEKFRCQNEFITNIDVSTLPNLKELFLSLNELTSLDISQNPNLEKLTINGNHITQLDLSQNILLEDLNCSSNQLTNLDSSQNINLIELYCNNNQLTSIDVTQNIGLEQLSIDSNMISEIDLSQNISIERIRASNNLLTNIDVSNNLNLRLFYCDNNLISALDVSNNLSLISLSCDENQIENLNISNLSNLEFIKCNDNMLEILNVQNGYNHEMNTMQAFNNPNLLCIQVDDVDFANDQLCDLSNENGWCKDKTAFFSEDCNLGINDVSSTQIILYPNPTQDFFTIENSNNYQLNTLRLYDIVGNFVLHKENPNIIVDISKLSKGLYFVKIKTNQGNFIQKMIKE